MTPYMTEAEAKLFAAQIFQDAMNRWTEFCTVNYPHKVASTKLSERVVVWKPIGRNTAGQTHKTRVMGDKHMYTIVMNTNYLYSKDVREFINSTLRHEIAHAVANMFNPNSWGHDKTWKAIARVMGDSGERCHNYSLPENIAARKVTPGRMRTKFVCPHCGAEFDLTPLMIKRCNAGGYCCKHCKTDMKEIVNQ